MIYLVQPTPVKAPVIADLEGLGLGDAPFHQGIAVLRVILAPMGLIGGDPDVMQGILLLFEPVDFLRDQMSFELDRKSVV